MCELSGDQDQQNDSETVKWCWMADNSGPDERWTEQLFMVWISKLVMVQADSLLLYTHIHIGAITGDGGSTGDNTGWGGHPSMAMTDSHPTWGKFPPLELDCTTRPDRRGELLCLPSPDRPIRAARNWYVLGPTAGLEGLWGKKTPLHQNTKHRIAPIMHLPRNTCTVEQSKYSCHAYSGSHQN